MVWEDSLCGEDGMGLVAAIVELELPAKLQGRGLGPCLLNMLAQSWRRLGVVEVRAAAASEAGEKAFTSWGFREWDSDETLKQFWLPLTAPAASDCFFVPPVDDEPKVLVMTGTFCWVLPPATA